MNNYTLYRNECISRHEFINRLWHRAEAHKHFEEDLRSRRQQEELEDARRKEQQK